MDSEQAQYAALGFEDTAAFLGRFTEQRAHVVVEVGKATVGTFAVNVERAYLSEDADAPDAIVVILGGADDRTPSGEVYDQPFIAFGIEEFHGGRPSPDYDDVISVYAEDRVVTFWPVADAA